MKTLDDAVIELNGVWKTSFEYMVISKDGKIHFTDVNGLSSERFGSYFFHMAFHARAKELGFINGYRWGVEYKTDGKRPDLPDDVSVSVSYHYNKGFTISARASTFAWGEPIDSFKIDDSRYKPADTSYLEKPALEPVPEEEDWYDYDNEKMLSNPPTGAILEGFWPKDSHPKWGRCVVAYSSSEHLILKFDGGVENYYSVEDIGMSGAKLRPLDHNRKAKAEHKRVVDAAYDEAIKAGCVDFGQWLNHLYDKGFLKLPE